MVTQKTLKKKKKKKYSFYRLSIVKNSFAHYGWLVGVCGGCRDNSYSVLWISVMLGFNSFFLFLSLVSFFPS